MTILARRMHKKGNAAGVQLLAQTTIPGLCSMNLGDKVALKVKVLLSSCDCFNTSNQFGGQFVIVWV